LDDLGELGFDDDDIVEEVEVVVVVEFVFGCVVGLVLGTGFVPS